MSMKTLPLLFINLGGEMMYILDQRLRAQSIPDEKAKKVLYDIVSMMYNKRFMEELFKPQYLYSKKAMRTVFDRLAHASIMRLNAASMDKLYDLMMMAFKHQVLMAHTPSDILLITLNHIDAIRNFIKDSQPIRQQVDLVYQLLIETYGGLKSGDFYLIRMTLLNFFQDMHIRMGNGESHLTVINGAFRRCNINWMMQEHRQECLQRVQQVSIFLKDHSQNSNGRFAQPLCGSVGWGIEVPGLIRYNDDKTKTDSPYHTSKNTISSTDMDMSNPDPLATAQLDLLALLIGSRDQETQQFRLNLFDTDSDEQQYGAQCGVKQVPSETDNTIKISATKADDSELQRIMGEMQMDDSNDAGKGDDLLSLMDNA